MALRQVLLPWDSQPQEAVRADPAHPLARTLDNLWLPDAIEPVDVISGLRITGAPAGSALGIGVGGRAIVGTTGGSAAALPSAVSAYPAVLVAYGTFTANNGWTLLSFTGSGGLLSLGVSSTGNAQLIARRNFGTARTMAGAATYPVGTPVCVIAQIFSDTDYRLYVNGEQTNGSLSFGTGGTWLTSQLPLAAQHPGSLFLAGQGFGKGSISDADALAISANPALLWQLFEPQRVMVPVPAGGGVTGTSTGTLTTSGTAAGTIAVAGASDQSIGIIGSAAGTVAIAGASTGALTLAGSSAATVAIAGASAASVGLTGSATASAAVAGASSQTVALTGTAAGVVPIGAASAATFTLLSLSTGQISITGASAGALTLAGTATGTTTGAVSGASDQALPISGTAAGAVAVAGSSSAALQLSGSATGTVGASAITGQSAVTLGLTGSGAGQIMVRGVSACTINLVATPAAPFVPDSTRILLITADLRTLAIAADARTLAIAAETRTARITR